MNCFAVITPGFRVTRFWSNLINPKNLDYNKSYFYFLCNILVILLVNVRSYHKFFNYELNITYTKFLKLDIF